MYMYTVHLSYNGFTSDDVSSQVMMFHKTSKLHERNDMLNKCNVNILSLEFENKRLQKNKLSEVGFEPTPAYADQNTHNSL